MSAFPAQLHVPDEDDPRVANARERMPFPGVVYGTAVAVVAFGIAIPVALGLNAQTNGWINFALVATGAAVAQLFNVRHAHRNQSYHAHGVFVIPAILLLRPELLVLVAIIQHVPEWLKDRFPWYIQSFNICVFTIANMASWAVSYEILHASKLIPNEDIRFGLAGFAACLLYVGINHVVLAPMLRLARGLSLRELRDSVLSFESLSTDFVLATLGLGVAAFWKLNPYLVPFAIAPLLLIHRCMAFSIPMRLPITSTTGVMQFVVQLAQEITPVVGPSAVFTR